MIRLLTIMIIVGCLFFVSQIHAECECEKSNEPVIELSLQLEAKQLQLQNVHLEFRYLQERMKVLQYQAKSLQTEIQELTVKKALNNKEE